MQLEYSSASSSNIQNHPGDNLNSNLPVLSKISCKDGSSKQPMDGADNMISPDKIFGFQSPSDKKDSRKRGTQWINKNSRRAPITTIPPDIIY